MDFDDLRNLNSRVGLKFKLLVAFVSIILLTVMSIVFLVNRTVRREVEGEIRKKLVQSESVFETTQSMKVENLTERTRMFSQVAFVRGLIANRETGAISQFARDSLDKLRSSILIFTDEHGNVLARTDTDRPGDNLSSFGPVSRALEGEETRGLFVAGNDVYLLVTLPLRAGPSVLGTVSTGIRVDDKYVLDFKKITGADVSFLMKGKIIASVWEGERRDSLAGSIGQAMGRAEVIDREGTRLSIVDLRLDEETFSSIMFPIRDENSLEEGNFLLQFSKDQALGFFYHVRNLIFFLSGIALFVALWVSFIVSRQVARPMQELTQTTLEIARSGDLTRETSINSEDEVGKLAQSFNEMITRLRGLMIHVRDAGVQINLKTAEIGQGTHQQATGASQQAAAVSELSATVEELSQTAGHIATNAEALTSASEETVQGISEIKARVDQMAKNILNLGDKSHSIGNITKVIDDLADRTNLLALNAAIEAARAGEAGHGFAVVAAEVGKLAERSAESTGEIRQLINEIQAEVNSTIAGVEDTEGRTKRGLDLVGNAARVTKEIFMSTQQQKSAAEQVVGAIVEIDKVTTTFVATTKQTATAANELNELADQLNSAISGFHLDQNGKAISEAA